MAWAAGGCGSGAEPVGVQSHLSGRITVASQVDSSTDYSGFRVLVAEGRGRRIDTLGHAITQRDGRFALSVRAEERGIRPLMIWGRQGRQRLATLEYVVAEGDSATLDLEFPLRRNRIAIRSRENAAMTAYRNTMALHRQALVRRIQAAATEESVMAQSIRQTSSILWDLQRTYDGTYAGQLAAVESLALLEGWNDSLVVHRAPHIEATNPRYGEAARIARRAAARLSGQDSALQMVHDFQNRAVSDEQRAALQAAIVSAYIDSLDRDKARAAASALRTRFPDSPWAAWAERARYEVDHLLPGLPAPDFALRTLRGDSLTLEALRGHVVVLEFYDPGGDLYSRQLPTRNAIHDATRGDSVAIVSVSLQPDTLLNRAVFEGRRLPGHHAIAPGGWDGPLAQRYNLAVQPTRFLLDANGRIVDKYVGATLLVLQDDLAALLRNDEAPSETRSPPPAVPRGPS